MLSLAVTPLASASSSLGLEADPGGLSEIDRLRQQVEERRSELQESADSRAHESFLSVVGELILQLSSEATAASRQEVADLNRQYWEVAELWIENQPDAIGGYLALLKVSVDEDAVESLVGRIEERFASHFPALKSTAQDLEDRGWRHLGSTLLESYADRHPEDARAHEAIVEAYQQRSANARAAKWARLWFERFPSDPGAVQAHLALNHSTLEREDLAELAGELADSVADGSQKGICIDLEKASAVAEAARCWLHIEATDTHLLDFERRSLARALAAAGKLDELIRIGGGRDHVWRVQVITALESSGECGALESFLGQSHGPTGLAASQEIFLRRKTAQAMRRCGLDGATEAVFDLLRRAPPRQLTSLTLVRHLAPEERQVAESILLDRVYREPSNHDMQKALANFYGETGEPEKLLAHAVDWASHVSESEPALVAAERLMSAGLMDQVGPWIEEFLNREQTPSWLYKRAVEILRQIDEIDWARSVASEMAAATDSPNLAAEGHRQLASLEGEGSAGSYAGEPYLTIKEAKYLRAADKVAHAERMRAEGRLAEVVAEVEAAVRGPFQAGSLDLALAREYAEYGLLEHAATHYQAAAARAPDDVALLLSLAGVLTRGGSNRDGANPDGSNPESRRQVAEIYRRVLDVSPGHDGALSKLSYLFQKQENFAAIIDLLGPQGDRLSFKNRLAYGHALMRVERWQDAARELEAAAGERPLDHQVQLNLASAYAQTERLDEAESAYRSFLRLTDWSETRVGECTCLCGMAGQRAAVRKWLQEHAGGS